MMAAATMPPNLPGLARALPAVPGAAASNVFAGLLDSSGLGADAAAGAVAVSEGAAPPAPTPANGVPSLPAMPKAADLPTSDADNARPLPVGDAPVASFVLAASPDIAAALSTATLAERAVSAGKVNPVAAPGNAESPSVPATETNPEATAIDQANLLPVSAPDVLPPPASDLHPTGPLQPGGQVPAALVEAYAAGSAPSTESRSVQAPAATSGPIPFQATKSPAPRGNGSLAPGNSPVVAPMHHLPQALPITSSPTFADGSTAPQTGSVLDMVLLPGVAPTASSPLASAQLASAVGDPSLRPLDVANDNRWIASLAQDIAAFQGDDGMLRFQLLPRQLGRIEVSVQTGSEGVSVRVSAENAAAQTILAAAQSRLVDDLRNNGVRIVAADIGMQTQGGAHDRRDHDRSNPDQRWNFIETGHAADLTPHRTGRPGSDRLA
jgi:flagellar hook-length control protein FliK